MAHTAKDFVVEGGDRDDVDRLNQALAYLDQSPTANAVMQRLIATKTTIKINHEDDDSYQSDSNTINWDPRSGLIAIDPVDNAGSIGVGSAALGLAHEAVHATDEHFADEQACDIDYDFVAERQAVEVEDKIAQELGEPQRYNHGGETVWVNNATEHTATDNNGGINWVERNPDGATEVVGVFKPGSYPGSAPMPEIPPPPPPADVPTAPAAPAGNSASPQFQATATTPESPSTLVAEKLLQARASARTCLRELEQQADLVPGLAR
ncbi:M91 family zinc metallopeptidase [Telmatospirillum siberiense]|uniref:Uncharacterized protein n=1 Tax=Telmatospirillum siberiense TaxID=382514 RepID=A0A2N3PP63_9PROT|nr:M91 family zinc metallopeptidase [Telmatospirillum siberiense]PKU22195.1 hypothetical protein CWS72_22835 [Telmatospirillum siberiense]